MTNNNNKKPINCACGDMTCESFVAGNQCFRCEQVDNRKRGFTFDDTVDEWNEWFQQVQQRIVEFKAGPNYIDPSRYANGEPRDEPRPEPMQWKHYD
jgi:alpha-L-arabinofuranosidase